MQTSYTCEKIKAYSLLLQGEMLEKANVTYSRTKNFQFIHELPFCQKYGLR